MRRKELQERGNERGTMLILRWGKKIDITEDWKKSDDWRCGDMHGKGHLDFLQRASGFLAKGTLSTCK